jgi:hypothetical protein
MSFSISLIAHITGHMRQNRLSRDQKDNGKRYVKWFDEHLTKYDYPQNFEDRLKFVRQKCWKLRCAFLHEGSIEGIPDINNFNLCITEPSDGMYGLGSYTKAQIADNRQPINDVFLKILEFGSFSPFSFAKI